MIIWKDNAVKTGVKGRAKAEVKVKVEGKGRNIEEAVIKDIKADKE
jgi:hypothetical protein